MEEKKFVKCPTCGQEASLFKSDDDREEEKLRSCCRVNLSEAVKEDAMRKYDMPKFY